MNWFSRREKCRMCGKGMEFNKEKNVWKCDRCNFYKVV